MPIIINPGTEPRSGATLENAEKIVDAICIDLGIERSSIARHPEGDDPSHGLFSYVHVKFEIDVPGDDPNNFLSSTPCVSRRMYVDGSSWLYGYGLGIMQEALGKT
jgi:hypothetical protein